jgi:hypothetical protein
MVSSHLTPDDRLGDDLDATDQRYEKWYVEIQVVPPVVVTLFVEGI